ncbi:MAG: potassium transporter TrkG [Eubacteriales bacterium]|nr:potassium transporter TrkG [Eubacteriales bacterium]
MKLKNLFHSPQKALSPFRIISGSFALAILAGSLLLMLPAATRGPGGASFGEALFTATSAVCVTGLVVQNTATYWSSFGQFIIMLLIQIGGMGVVTISVLVTVISGKKISLKQRSTMQEAIAAPGVGGIVRLTDFIIKTTVIVELLGAAVMAPVFIREFGAGKGLWYGLFHSVSAFCNAGFDLMGVSTPYSSLTAFSAQPVINLTVMALIIIGGIGFLTWDDIRTHGLHLRRYRMQSKVILSMTCILIFLPAAFFGFYEFGNPQWSGMSLGERFWGALFQAVTPRTAGFNTVDLGKMSEPGQVITAALMLIGGAPGSTAGGMKTTTVAVLAAALLSVFRRSQDAQMFGRRVAEGTIKYAAAILLVYLMLFLGGGLLISCVEKLPVLPCLFETASAIGTVGLTLGLTPELGGVSRAVLILLMYLGRVGSLTFVFAALSDARRNISKLPQEKITVG